MYLVLHNLLNYLAHKNPALGLDFWNLCQTKKFVFILDFRNGPFDDFRHVWIKSQNFKSLENLKKVFLIWPHSQKNEPKLEINTYIFSKRFNLKPIEGG